MNENACSFAYVSGSSLPGLGEWARTRLSKRFDLSMNSSTPIFRNIPRDYYNTMMAKHIGMLDPLLTMGKDYHLRQRYRGRKPSIQLIGEPGNNS